MIGSLIGPALHNVEVRAFPNTSAPPRFSDKKPLLTRALGGSMP